MNSNLHVPKHWTHPNFFVATVRMATDAKHSIAPTEIIVKKADSQRSTKNFIIPFPYKHRNEDQLHPNADRRQNGHGFADAGVCGDVGRVGCRLRGDGSFLEPKRSSRHTCSMIIIPLVYSFDCIVLWNVFGDKMPI